MMKMMILAPRRKEMSHAQFRTYVIDVHGPLVRSVPEVAGDIRHYHYNFPVAGAKDLAFGHPLAEHLDIVTQGWFDSRDAQLQNMKHQRYMDVIRPDEHRFADTARAVMHYTQEASIVAGDSLLAKYKVFYFRRRRLDLTRKAFQLAWQTRFSAALSNSAAFGEVCSKYVQNQTLPEADHPDGLSTKFFDAIDELFLYDTASFARLSEDRRAMTAIRSAENDLLEPEFSRCLVTETVPNIP
jgi:hypothetical protein